MVSDGAPVLQQTNDSTIMEEVCPDCPAIFLSHGAGEPMDHSASDRDAAGLCVCPAAGLCHGTDAHGASTQSNADGKTLPRVSPSCSATSCTPGVLLLLASLVIPLGCFLALGRHVRTRWQQWVLLATVLLLSIAVTGINVGFSYIGNFFTNALVQKNQAQAYLFVGVYGVGFLIGIPIVALYGYVQAYLGLHWRDLVDQGFFGQILSQTRLL